MVCKDVLSLLPPPCLALNILTLCLYAFFFAYRSFLLPAAQAADFTDWLVDFKAKAKAEGISENTVLEAFEGVNAPIAQVVELDRKQPEGRLSFAQYRRNIVNPKRIAKGRKLLRENRVLLDGIARQYGCAAALYCRPVGY